MKPIKVDIPSISKSNNFNPNDIPYYLNSLKPFLYHSKKTIEQTKEDWDIFINTYNEVNSKTDPFDFFLFEETLDKIYINKPELLRPYINNKFYILNEQIYTKPAHLEIFRPSDNTLEIANSIGNKFSFKSINTYTSNEEEMLSNLQEMYNISTKFKEEYTHNDNFGLNKINFILATFNDEMKHMGCHKSVNISDEHYTYVNNNKESFETFYHEYTHFIDYLHYEVFDYEFYDKSYNNHLKERDSNIKQNIFIPAFYTNKNNENVSNYIEHHAYFRNMTTFESNKKYLNNELFQIQNDVYKNTYPEYFKDYQKIIYLNITGKTFDEEKNLAKRYENDFQLLKSIIPVLQEQKVIDSNISVKKFIEEHMEFLSDTLSVFSYYKNTLDQSLDTIKFQKEELDILKKVDSYGYYRTYDKLEEIDPIQAQQFLDNSHETLKKIQLKHYHFFNEHLINLPLDKSLLDLFIESLDYIKPKYSPKYILKDKKEFLSIFLNTLKENELKIYNDLDSKESNSEHGPLFKRLYSHLHTINLYIEKDEYLPENLFIYNKISDENNKDFYYTLQGELLAHSISTDCHLKPEHVKKENVQFLQKYINFLSIKCPFEKKKYNEDIIKQLDITREKEEISNSLKKGSLIKPNFSNF